MAMTPINPVTMPQMPMVSGPMTSGTVVDGAPVARPGAGVAGSAGVGTSTGSGFSGILQNAVQNVSNAHEKVNDLAVQAATGNLRNIHDYTIAATEAQILTQTTVAVRNKAVEAFQEIMRMPL
jgi:flagellar hook-basal body complex protein FliE